MPIRVACVADRDIIPDAATKHSVIGRRKIESRYTPTELLEKADALHSGDGGPVKTFVSPKWTLEFDLAWSGLSLQLHIAVKLASKKNELPDAEKGGVVEEAQREYTQWKETRANKEELAALACMPIFEGRVSKAETALHLAQYLESEAMDEESLRCVIPAYILNAIDYVTGNGG